MVTRVATPKKLPQSLLRLGVNFVINLLKLGDFWNPMLLDKYGMRRMLVIKFIALLVCKFHRKTEPMAAITHILKGIVWAKIAACITTKSEK